MLSTMVARLAYRTVVVRISAWADTLTANRRVLIFPRLSVLFGLLRMVHPDHPLQMLITHLCFAKFPPEFEVWFSKGLMLKEVRQALVLQG